MIKGGIGGGNTKTGLQFETRVNLKSVISEIEGYKVDGDIVYKEKEKVAQIYTKGKLYGLLKSRKINYKDYISKKLLPDECILVGETLFIIEMKFQYVAGSVDEKLQTCDFKRKQYVKLATPADFKVEYIYVLNDWFKKAEYRDVLEYIEMVGCHYYFNEIPLSVIGI